MSNQQETVIPVLIDVQDTPNPQVRKFALGFPVTGTGEPIELSNFAQARQVSDLAADLFDFPETKNVFLGKDFISVMVAPETSWDSFSPVILSTISNYLSAKKTLVKAEGLAKASSEEAAIRPEDQEIVEKIKGIIEHRVRPAVAQDGGDILFRSYQDGIVYLVLKGACAGCPSAQATLKDGVERLLKHFVPEVQEVRQAA
ncbi:iron transporter [Lasius niger]|uniref:NFU1 iron-sulfur cluster scaffold homolog, mitochondrial n=1 Tax=Lasius niger TaxID=67767 RepID=A0A0J7KT95_LASNI|nr:iron transporter [Lasius niger]